MDSALAMLYVQSLASYDNFTNLTKAHIMPYAPLTQPLQSVTVIEGKICTDEQLADRAKRARRQGQSMAMQMAASQEMIKQVNALFDNKFSYVDIAQQLGITTESVRYYLRKL